MSHFSKIRTNIQNKEYLVKALKLLNYNVKVGNYKCNGYQGTYTNVEVLVELPGTDYNIGFKNNDGSYELVADWYGIKNVDSESLVKDITSQITLIENKIKQEYAYSSTIEKLEEQGFSLEEEIREDGEIRIKLTRIL
ncbi:MAG: DUF1257 domain-containing protein [Candidatus Delongbacteria bacterium]|jgi:hypothetical protein|nr:DUF1257 domain-containing protein [Candidatus Delongbacteria bacterium]